MASTEGVAELIISLFGLPPAGGGSGCKAVRAFGLAEYLSAADGMHSCSELAAVGQIFAETLATNGAKTVYIVGRRKESLEQVVASWNISKKPGYGDIVALPGDVSSKQTITKIVEDWKAHGETKLDILVNSAGKDNH